MTLCGWSAKQTIPLSVKAQNQTKGLESRSPRDWKWARERESRSWNKEAEKAVGDGRQRGTAGSRHGTSERPDAWDRVEQQWGKTSQDEVTFLVALWKFRERCTSALVYRCTKECRVSQLNLLALELTQTLIVRLFFVRFLPLPWLYFLCCKEMCDTPIGTTRWFTGQDWNGLKKLMYSGGGEGVWSHRKLRNLLFKLTVEQYPVKY